MIAQHEKVRRQLRQINHQKILHFVSVLNSLNRLYL
jgi:hypothetical protein